MRYKKGDITYIKVKDQLIQVVINKEVKPYHGKSYYTKGEIRYFVSRCEKTPTDLSTLRENKLNQLGIK